MRPAAGGPAAPARSLQGHEQEQEQESESESESAVEALLRKAIQEGWLQEKDAAGMLRGLQAKVARGEATGVQLTVAVEEKVAWLEVLAEQRARKRMKSAVGRAAATPLPRCSVAEAAAAELMGATVLYEDESLLFVDKPCGCVP